jgi:hypothetical protein
MEMQKFEVYDEMQSGIETLRALGVSLGYLTAHPKPRRRKEPTSGCNHSDCEYRLKRRAEAPCSDSRARTHELRRRTKQTHSAALTSLTAANTGADRRCKQTFFGLPDELPQRIAAAERQSPVASLALRSDSSRQSERSVPSSGPTFYSFERRVAPPCATTRAA